MHPAPHIPHHQEDSDNSITVSQLENVLLKFMKARGTNDLVTMFREIDGTSSWHSSPTKGVKAIADLEPFYTLMLEVCPNGIFPRRRMEEALINVNKIKWRDGTTPHMWHFANRDIGQAASQLGTTIRIGSSKLRDLKSNPRAYKHAMLGLSLIHI